MATCPKCFGALTEDHKCPYGLRQRVVDALSAVVVGGVLGGIAALVIDENAPTLLVLAASALGAVIASAVRQAVRPRP